MLEIACADGRKMLDVPVLVRIDTLDELEYFRNGGILHYVLQEPGEAGGLSSAKGYATTLAPDAPAPSSSMAVCQSIVTGQ